MLLRPDVCIVGSGTAGCVTARRCSEMGLKTLILERKPKDKIGEKVCGDEVSKSHFEATGVSIPDSDEISTTISGADIFPPSLENELQVRGWVEFNGWTLNRKAFGQRLLHEALDSGAVIRTRSHVSKPIVQGNSVVGVQYRDLREGTEKQVYSKLVIDASGYPAAIRRNLDSGMIENKINKEDVAFCYREILRLKMPLTESHVARVFLGSSIAPEGYAWIFPKNQQTVNAGIGVTGGEQLKSPRKCFEDFKNRYPLLAGSKVLTGAGGAVPVRRPLDSLVGGGVAFVGDAALQVNPIHGGGIGPGMRAGVILGEVAKMAIAGGDLSPRGLWQYNIRYQRNYGKRLASLEIFRKLLENVTDEEMDFGFKKRLLTAEDLMSANRGEGFSIGIVDKMKRLFRGISKIGLLRRIQKAASLMRQIEKVYSMYPGHPEDLEEWKTQITEILKDADFE
ncbi:MAG: geranylgeranyl reductase family protein [Promethearchaeia archaeon]